MAKTIAILGSTGSIGTQTLDVVEKTGGIRVLGLTANRNIALLEEQIRKFHPKMVAVMEEEQADVLQKKVGARVKVVSGVSGLCEVAAMDGTDTVVTSAVGTIGILPTIAAIEAKKDIALANKETLVSGGKLVMELVKKNHVRIFPVDSEHSAIFQCLKGNGENKIRRIFLTASGGALFGKTRKELENISISDVLKHPKWNMGKKVTVDSASLMNKGLEVIEAKWLFDVAVEQIEVLVHPQCIVHSAVEYEDGAVIAQMGEADMRIPIAYALSDPKRFSLPYPKMDFSKGMQLTFAPPDLTAFPCLELAYRAIADGGLMPAVMNAANEAAVALFLDEKIPFLEIPALIEKTMCAYTNKEYTTVEELLAADRWARAFAEGAAPE